MKKVTAVSLEAVHTHTHTCNFSKINKKNKKIEIVTKVCFNEKQALVTIFAL